MGTRQLKKEILALLRDEAFEKSLEKIYLMPARGVVNPLFSFFYNTEELVKWRAITAMGAVVARLADEDLESARIVMRRLMWNLNDESGGIGWGSPEAMGEIMARHDILAKEYACRQVIFSNTRCCNGGFSGDWADLPMHVLNLFGMQQLICLCLCDQKMLPIVDWLPGWPAQYLQK